jgi:uncharacterized membrane protein YidH (DUF202 family)
MGTDLAGRGGGEGPRTRDHLANVRTLLAWARVGLAAIALGYTADRLGALEVHRHLAPANPFKVYGVVATGAGALAAAAALVRFLRRRAMIEGAELRVGGAADLALVALVGLGGLALLALIALVR